MRVRVPSVLALVALGATCAEAPTDLGGAPELAPG